jgi:hypothetical protein
MARIEGENSERRRVELQVLPSRHRQTDPADGQAAAELPMAELRT